MNVVRAASERNCPNVRSDAASLTLAFAGLTQRTGRDERRRFKKLAAQQKIVVSAHIALDFPAIGSIAVHVDGLLLVAALAWPRAPGLWWCKHRDRRDADSEDEDDGQQANQ